LAQQADTFSDRPSVDKVMSVLQDLE